jgi:serine/threonine-protein kinase
MSGDFEMAPGTVLGGKYRVDRVLGQGGMGVVLAARHLQLDQPFALKVMLSEYSRHPEAVARFLREARAAVRVQHENVARVTDVSETASGIPFMVMELLEGTDLESLSSSRGPLPIAETVELVLQACAGVAEAHALGIVHRDLKPSNLFLTRRRDGSPLVKVLDFGISKVLDTRDGSLTATSAMIGSPLYMSPEQVRTAKDVDARTDVWSLGAILYELLTGVTPFAADSASAVLAKVVADEPAPPRQHRPDLPLGLQDVVLSCLRKNRDERPRTVEALAQALVPFADSGLTAPAPAHPAPNGTVSSSHARSRQVLALVGLGTALVVALAAASLQWSGRDDDPTASTTAVHLSVPTAAAMTTSDPPATAAAEETSSRPPAPAAPAPSTTRVPAPAKSGAPRRAPSRTEPPAPRPKPPRRGDDLFADPK